MGKMTVFSGPEWRERWGVHERLPMSELWLSLEARIGRIEHRLRIQMRRYTILQ